MVFLEIWSYQRRRLIATIMSDSAWAVITLAERFNANNYSWSIRRVERPTVEG